MLKALRAEVEAHGRLSSPSYQTYWSAENSVAYVRSLEQLEGSIKGLNEVEIKMDPFDVTKSLEDFWVTPERLAMAAKKTAD